jgi:hypothetical protein
MPELDEQLRAVIDGSVKPLSLDDVVGRSAGRRRSHRRVVVAGVTVLATAAVIAAVIVVNGSGRRQTHVTTGPPPAVGWHRINPGPLSPRSDSVTAWTGSTLLVWGGDNTSGMVLDGARYNPSSDGWQLMAPSPLTAPMGHFGVWDGTELLVWEQDWSGRTPGGRGAAYNPATNRWRPLAPNALPADSTPAVTVWDGHEVLLWTASRPDGTTRPVKTYQAAYNPATNTWRAVPAGPLDVTNASGTWDGSEFVIVGWLYNAGNGVFPTGGDHVAAAYNPETNAWRSIPRPPWDPAERSSTLTLAWTGSEVVAYTYSLHSATYNPATNAWQALSDLPLAARECNPSSASVNGVVLASYCGQEAQFDSAVRRWATLTSPIRAESDQQVTAAGPSYVIWGAAPGTAPTANATTETVAWLYTPPSPTASVLGRPGCSPPSPITTTGIPEVEGTPDGTTSLWGLVFGSTPPKVGEQVKFVWRMTGTGPLKVTTVAPDGSSRALLSGPTPHSASSYNRPGDEWDTSITFDTPGCWTIRLTRIHGAAAVYLEVTD